MANTTVSENANDVVFSLRMVPIKFGIGAAQETGFELHNLGVKKVLVITDKTISKETQILSNMKYCIEDAGIEVEVWDEVEPEPSSDSMKKAIRFASGGNFDGLIGLGGGSSIDTAKVVNLFTTYPAEFLDYIAAPIGKDRPVPGKLKPLVAIPTTAGTGSETTGVAITDLTEPKTKSGFSSWHLLPSLAIIDPLNTVMMPPSVTANTGIDALMHAIEAFTARPYYTRPRPVSPENRPLYVGSNPVTDTLAEKAIELIGENLIVAIRNGTDINVRLNMSIASFIAGVAFGNAGVHIPHAMAYPVGGRKHIPHGVAVAVHGPAFLKFAALRIPEKLARVAGLLGENIDGLLAEDAALKASEALIKLMRKIDLPNGLEEFGFTEGDIPGMAKDCLRLQRLLAISPFPVQEEDIAQIYKSSMRYW